MARTRRKQPIRRETKAQRLEREWERQVEAQQRTQKSTEQAEPQPVLTQDYPPNAEAIRQEAEVIINRRVGTPPAFPEVELALPDAEKARGRSPYSVQQPATDVPSEVGGGLVWWTGGRISDYIPIGDYGDPQRVRDIRTFCLVAPFVLNAEAVLTKKVQALQWTVEGGRNLAQKWQRRLNHFENGDGWDTFIARWIRGYCESDKGSYVELIRAAPGWAVRVEEGIATLTPRGERAIERGDDKAWEIVDARVMDPVNCFPTVSTEFPLIYQNSFTGKRHKMRNYQYMKLLDMPAVDDRYPGHGVCAISRAIWAAQEDRMITRYCMEKMSENPGAGLGIINASTTALETALKTAKGQREARGVVYYKGIIFLPVLDPSGSTKLEFLSFSGLPDGFDRLEVYNICKEVVATAFGLDILELGAISGRLGTATQARVAAEKGRTKSIGALMQGVERAFRYKLLPESVVFSVKKHDQAEEKMRAEIDAIYFENAIRYAQFAVDPRLPTQYLADKGALPNEPPYIIEDLTRREIVVDVETPEAQPEEEEGRPQVAAGESTEVAEGPEGAAEAEIVKRWRREGPRVRIDREGHITWVEMPYRLMLQKQVQPFQPAASGPLPLLDPRIRRSEVLHANSTWNRVMPEYLDLVNAEA